MVSVLDERPLSTSTTSNWVARNGGLPPRVRAIVRKLMERGFTESHAIAVALNMVKETAATGRVFHGRAKARASTDAAHTKATAQWEALKARAHAHTLAGSPALELAMLRAEQRHTIELATATVTARSVPASLVHAYLRKNYPDRVLGWVDSATWTKRTVRLSDIKMGRRPGGRDDEKTKGIAQAVADGKPMDPVVLVDTGEPNDDGAGLEIADGYHRTLGFDRAGKTTIEAYVGSGCGKHGPWESDMHAAKLNLAARDALVIALATTVSSSTDGPRITMTAAGRRAVLKAHIRRRARALGVAVPEGVK